MRIPIAAGTLYPSRKEEFKQISSLIYAESTTRFNSISALFVPNGKFDDFKEMYIQAYSHLVSIPDATTFILFSDNKLKTGKPVSISNEDWFTLMGKVFYDKELGENIKKHSRFAEFDATAHLLESSIEIQLPFIQSIVAKPKMVGITISVFNREIVDDIVSSIIDSASILNRDIVVIGTGQFLHSSSYEEAESKTNKLIKVIHDYSSEEKVNSLVDIILHEEGVVNPAVFCIPLLYSVRNGFKPVVLSKKILKTDIKEEGISYLSLAYVK